VLSPKTRQEVQAIVRNAVEQALAPILRDHRALEEQVQRAVRDIRQEIERAVSRSASAPQPGSSNTLPGSAAEPASAAAVQPASTNVFLSTAMQPAPPQTVPANGASAATSDLGVAVARSPAVTTTRAAALDEAIVQSAANAASLNDVDMSWQLSGARRKRMAAWIFALLAVLAVGGFATAAILSQLGYKI
jgi:hypothetical protein